MARLSELSTELILLIASFLSQVDLLNVSLTDKRLNGLTEPELYREYINTKIYGRSLKPFLQRIIQRPDLARHVRRLDLKPWSSLSDMNPDFRGDTYPGMSQKEYEFFTNAAQGAGLISDLYPYERRSALINRAAFLLEDSDTEEDGLWFEYIFDPFEHINNISFDRKFCQLLRAGLEDPQVVLILALLPNLREIQLRGMTHDRNALPWRAPLHNFHSLRRLTACATDGQIEWPLEFFNDHIQSPKLKTLEVYSACEWGHYDTDGDDAWHRRSLSLPTQSVNLTRLMLQYCAFSYSGMKTLLSACKGLTSLYYSAGGKEVGLDNFTCPELVELLQPHKLTLRELQLDMTVDWNYEKKGGYLTSLAEFTRLEKLLVTTELYDPFAYQRGTPGKLERIHDRLPVSLRELDLIDDELDDTLRQLGELVAVRSEKFPQLKTIRFQVQDRHIWFECYGDLLPPAEPGLDLILLDMRKACEANRTFFERWVTEYDWDEVKWNDGLYFIERKTSRWSRLSLKAASEDSEWSTTEGSDDEDSGDGGDGDDDSDDGENDVDTEENVNDMDVDSEA